MHIINGVVEIGNKIIKSRTKIKLSLNVFPLFAVIIIILSVYASIYSVIPEKVIYISSLFAMPEGFTYKISLMKDDFISKFTSENKTEIIQNGGSINDLIKFHNISDLTVTPDDIVKNTEKYKKIYNSGKYEADGTVVEKTFTDDQSTDSFGNVYVRNVTEDSHIDVESIINAGCFLPLENTEKPVVLIYHTHTTESYLPVSDGSFSSDYPTRNNDKNVNMVRVGEEIVSVLESKGIGVIHDKTIYDSKYTGAYDKSREGVTKILEKNPSIIITLDIHRDAVYYDSCTRVKPVVETDGKKAAQMMIIAGAQGGNVSSFPDWKTNLSFAVNLQKEVNDRYPNLMKPIYFCNRKYNMDITPYSLLVEMGTDVNTLEEAAFSGRLLGDVLADYIKNNKKGTEK